MSPPRLSADNRPGAFVDDNGGDAQDDEICRKTNGTIIIATDLIQRFFN